MAITLSGYFVGEPASIVHEIFENHFYILKCVTNINVVALVR